MGMLRLGEKYIGIRGDGGGKRQHGQFESCRAYQENDEVELIRMTTRVVRVCLCWFEKYNGVQGKMRGKMNMDS